MHITKRSILLALMTSVGVLLLGTGAALAVERAHGPESVVVAVAATPGQDGQVAISAQFASPQGQAFSSQEVSFFLEADFLGHSQVFLGSATTDATGTAQVLYTPTWEGPQRIVARLVGGEGHPATETTIGFDASDLRGVYAPEPPALARVREWTPLIVALVVVLVWATMALVLVRTAGGVLTAGRRRDVEVRGYPAHPAASASRPERR